MITDKPLPQLEQGKGRSGIHLVVRLAMLRSQSLSESPHLRNKPRISPSA